MEDKYEAKFGGTTEQDASGQAAPIDTRELVSVIVFPGIQPEVGATPAYPVVVVRATLRSVMPGGGGRLERKIAGSVSAARIAEIAQELRADLIRSMCEAGTKDAEKVGQAVGLLREAGL
jgi:hypothetical protein